MNQTLQLFLIFHMADLNLYLQPPYIIPIWKGHPWEVSSRSMKPNMTKDLPLPTQVVPTPTSQRMSGLDRVGGSSFLGSSWELHRSAAFKVKLSMPRRYNIQEQKRGIFDFQSTQLHNLPLPISGSWIHFRANMRAIQGCRGRDSCWFSPGQLRYPWICRTLYKV